VNSSSGSFVEIVKQDNTNVEGDSQPLEEERKLSKPAFRSEAPAQTLLVNDQSPLRSEKVVDELQLCMTENYQSNVNELVEDEAHMAQKTAYQLCYTSKFKQMNSEEIK